MKGNMERYQVVYSVLKTHIQFGIYGFGDVLPSIENAAADFFVSVDTMRAAYQPLQRDGLVTISTNIGTTVVRNYGKEEIEQNIQMFYAQCKPGQHVQTWLSGAVNGCLQAGGDCRKSQQECF